MEYKSKLKGKEMCGNCGRNMRKVSPTWTHDDLMYNMTKGTRQLAIDIDRMPEAAAHRQ